MLHRNKIKLVEVDDTYQPTLCIIVDTEEDFDWTQPLSRSATSTRSMDEQYRAQEIYAKYNAIPTYVMDYCIVDQEAAAKVVQDIYAQGLCDIGAHLHPWVNPPFTEEVNVFNGYHGNLPIELERAKLKHLTQKIEDVFGVKPEVFKAGRYGVGPNTGGLLKEFGYKVDCSVVPFLDVRNEHGPSFTHLPDVPYWFGEDLDLLEVSVTKGFLGRHRELGRMFAKYLVSSWGEKLRLRGICSKMGLFDLAVLTPEGLEEQDLINLLKDQLKDGHKVLSLTYHSSSLGINCSPYVKDEEARKKFLKTLDRILKVFTEELGGRIVPIRTLYDDFKIK